MENTNLTAPQRAAKALAEFLKMESAGGMPLMATAILALFITNSPLQALYQSLIDTPISIQIGALKIDKPLLLWINDGLMAIFFFLIGLEIKRRLSSSRSSIQAICRSTLWVPGWPHSR